MSEVTLNWKAPSISKIADFMETKSEEMQIDFAKACATIGEDNKVTINYTNARKWLTEKFDETGEITWENRPTAKPKKLSGADRIAQWLKK